MKRILAIVLVLVMVLGVAAGCKKDEDTFKVGFICLHDENSTYDLNFINAIDEAKEALGLKDDQIVIKKNVAETQDCYDTAADLVDEGCDVIFANSFGHEDFMIQAAKKFKDIEFCHATGVKAASQKLDNFHNAFASIYEGRYLAGVAAGMKLNEMIADGKITAEQAKIGYVGAFTYAEVISGYTSFYLGAKSECPSVTMDVRFTGSWYDPQLEQEAAESLIGSNCVLISQHADSMGAPSACESKGVPNVSYNGSTVANCPNTFIIASRINWAPYYEYMIECAQNDKAIDANWTGTISTESVLLTDVNDKVAAEGTAAKIAEVKDELVAGTRHVFDTSTFTLSADKNEGATVDADGHLTSYKYEGEEVVKDGYFSESTVISAPYFSLDIDGITRLDEKF